MRELTAEQVLEIVEARLKRRLETEQQEAKLRKMFSDGWARMRRVETEKEQLRLAAQATP